MKKILVIGAAALFAAFTSTAQPVATPAKVIVFTNDVALIAAQLQAITNSAGKRLVLAATNSAGRPLITTTNVTGIRVTSGSSSPQKILVFTK
jgi:2-phospho-L-lactate guanylyltransferase (CobY/MobA/RfbA family)